MAAKINLANVFSLSVGFRNYDFHVFQISAERPGMELHIGWSGQPYRETLGGRRYFLGYWMTGGFFLLLLWFSIFVQIEWPLLFKLAHPCHKCGRLWPIDVVEPLPDDPRWESLEWVAGRRGTWRGFWESLYTFSGKEHRYITGPLVWRGPCCINSYPDEYDDGNPDEWVDEWEDDYDYEQDDLNYDTSKGN